MVSNADCVPLQRIICSVSHCTPGCDKDIALSAGATEDHLSHLRNCALNVPAVHPERSPHTSARASLENWFHQARHIESCI